MKNCIAFLLLFSAYLPLVAQPFSLRGKIVDEKGGPLPGAHVQLLYPWEENYKSTLTAEDGSFLIQGIEPGGYAFKVSFLGFGELKTELTLANDLNLGEITLKEGTLNLSEVEIREKAPLATQLGDTTQYNARSFKTLSDASAEELVRKMPGVTVEGGRVQAQGEDVRQVLVDGRPFFGNDPTAALRNLPAEVIDKIQVFDQASDQSQFTGFDDGQTTKTINIITRPDMRSGQFGKVYGGYGSEERYRAGGNTSFFKGDSRISIIGQTNNINQQNFATEDLLGVVGGSGGRGRGGDRGGRRRGGGRFSGGGSIGDFLVDQQGGIATTHAFGLNYSDKWGEKMEITGSYFFNNTDNDSEQSLTREFVNAENVSEIYSERNSGNSDNFNHRLNFRLEYQIDSSNSIIMRPQLSLQQNDGFSSTFGRTSLGGEFLNQTENLFRSDLGGFDFSNNLLFRHRFSKPRRTLSINLRTGYNQNDGESFLDSESLFVTNGNAGDTLNQFSRLDLNGWDLASSLSYTEPLGENGMLMLNYRAGIERNETDRKTFDFVDATGDFDQLNETLSSEFSSDYLTQQIGGGYNFRKGRDLIIMARANFQWAQLRGDELFPDTIQIDRIYYSVLPMAMLRYNFSRQTNLRVFYRSNTQAPSAQQLQEVVDNTNPLQLTIGNPGLDQSTQHRLFARYSHSKTEKASVFFALISASYTDNYITNSIFLSETDDAVFDDIRLRPGAQLTRPVNLDGYWNLRSFITYGIPLKALKVNLNFNLNGTYTRAPGLIDGGLNLSHNKGIGAGITLSSNISDKVDFTISSRTNYNQVDNSLRTELDNEYWNQNTSASLAWVLPKGFVLRTDLNHQLYEGLSEGFDQNYLLWNAGFGKKLFKNQLGEITLSVFDLLSENQSITRNVTEVYIEDLQTNVLQRYAMLTFTYNFRNFGNPPAREERRDGRPPHMRNF